MHIPKAQLESICAGGDIAKIQEALTKVSGIKGVSESALANAGQSLVTIGELLFFNLEEIGVSCYGDLPPSPRIESDQC